MSHIAVRMNSTPEATSFASPVVLDFSADVGEGESILAYTIALSGFAMEFDVSTDVPGARKLGRTAITLIPNLVGNAVYVTGDLVLTDYDGNCATQAISGKEYSSVAVITAIALIGNAAERSSDGFVLGNVFGLASGTSTPNINVQSNSTNWGLISGFSAQANQDIPAEISGLDIKAVVNQAPGSDALTITATCETPEGPNVNGNADVAVLSIPNGISGSFQIVNANVTWSEPTKEGKLGTIVAVFDEMPEGQSIQNYGVLLEEIYLTYDTQAKFQVLVALSALLPAGNMITGLVTLNIHDGNIFNHHYISHASYVTAYLIAQFG